MDDFIRVLDKAGINATKDGTAALDFTSRHPFTDTRTPEPWKLQAPDAPGVAWSVRASNARTGEVIERRARCIGCKRPRGWAAFFEVLTCERLVEFAEGDTLGLEVVATWKSTRAVEETQVAARGTFVASDGGCVGAPCFTLFVTPGLWIFVTAATVEGVGLVVSQVAVRGALMDDPYNK